MPDGSFSSAAVGRAAVAAIARGPIAGEGCDDTRGADLADHVVAAIGNEHVAAGVYGDAEGIIEHCRRGGSIVAAIARGSIAGARAIEPRQGPRCCRDSQAVITVGGDDILRARGQRVDRDRGGAGGQCGWAEGCRCRLIRERDRAPGGRDGVRRGGDNSREGLRAAVGNRVRRGAQRSGRYQRRDGIESGHGSAGNRGPDAADHVVARPAG